MPKLVFLSTDVVLLLLLLAGIGYVFYVRRKPDLLLNWRRVFQSPAALSASLVLLVFVVIALLDSIHYRPLLPLAPGSAANAPPAYATRTFSVLDAILMRPLLAIEKTYSAPLAYASFSREPMVVDGKQLRVFPRLTHGGAHLRDPERDGLRDVLARGISGAAAGVLAGLLAGWLLAAWLGRGTQQGTQQASALPVNSHRSSRRTIYWTLAIIGAAIGACAALMPLYHVLGTDRTGNDVLIQAIKSVRTAIVLGGLTTLATLPFAIVLGIMAGYFKGWVDDLIQYIYTTLSAVPNVLLIAAFVLMIQVYIDKNPDLFETGVERADLRLLLLALVLGVTGWASLCRLLRGETLKLRELDYVQAATAFGVSHARIMARHILPNVMHVVLITVVLDFSAIVLYEAVLSYVGVGVDPSTSSFGSMINLARSEMARDPLVWWNLATAFTFMLTLVLAANLFADGVREAFDPRARSFRARVPKRAVTARTEPA